MPSGKVVIVSCIRAADAMNTWIQGLVVDGGGEKKEGIVGNVVGMLGSEVAGKGGRVTFGIAGMVGNTGFGKDGICVVG